MQRSLEQVGIDVAMGKIDIDTIMTGKPRSLQDKLQRVLGVVSEMDKVSGAVGSGSDVTRLVTFLPPSHHKLVVEFIRLFPSFREGYIHHTELRDLLGSSAGELYQGDDSLYLHGY